MSKQIQQNVCATLLGIGLMSSVLAQGSNVDNTAKAKAATDQARAQLARELQIDSASIEALAVEPQTWPDSSLGCGKPGAQAAQVMTPGYVVTLKTTRGNYSVHVAEKYAVVCGAATQWRNLNRPGGRSAAIPLRNLNQQINLARADLSKKVGAPEKEIQTLNFAPTEWPDSSMDCIVAGEDIVNQKTQGYRVALQYAGRVYTYHTDLKRVRACPAIEVD